MHFLFSFSYQVYVAMHKVLQIKINIKKLHLNVS